MEFSGQYLTYTDYMALGGTLDIMPFNLLEFNARKQIDLRTQGRLVNVANVPQEVKLCMFELINSINNYNNNMNETRSTNVASEHTDGYTISYLSTGQIQEIIKAKSNDLEDVMTSYLADVVVNGTPVLYLGVC